MTIHSTPAEPHADPRGTSDIATVADLLRLWQTEGLLTSEQQQQLSSDPHAEWALHAKAAQRRGAPGHLASLAVEALGYLGGVVVVVAIGLIVGRFWSDIPAAVRMALALLCTAGLLGAGRLVPAVPNTAGDRLRSVLWLAACVTFGGAAAMVAYDVLDWREDAVLLTAVISGGLLGLAVWWWQPRALQHAAVFAALVISTGVAVSMIPGPAGDLYNPEVPPITEFLPGAAIWTVGLVWLMFSWARRIRPPMLGMVLGAVVMVFGSATMASVPAGVYFALATVVAVIALAVLMRNFYLLIVGALGALQTLPPAIMILFPGVIAAAGVLLLVGIGLVAAAILVARGHFGQPDRPPKHDWSTCSLTVATAITVVVVPLTAVFLVIGALTV